MEQSVSSPARVCWEIIGSSPVVKTLIIYNVRGGGSKLLYEILYEMVKFR